MSKNCRGVQGIGFVFVLFGIIAMAAAALMYFGAPSVELDIEDGVQIAQMFGIILFVIGLVQFIFGVVGMRAAKHENLLKPFSWMCGIDIILNLSVMGLTFTSSTALAMEAAREQARTGSALLGAVCFAFGGVVSPLVGMGNTLLSTGTVFVVCALCSWLCIRFGVRHSSRPAVA